MTENEIHTNDLIMPIFITEGENVKEPIESMKNIKRYSVNEAIKITQKAKEMGIKAVAPFMANVPENLKDNIGSYATKVNNPIHKFCGEIKKLQMNIGVITDPALDPFTTHGHDGIVTHGDTLNDKSVEQITQVAIAQAKAGADIIAPSDMMDGRIGAIRQGLNDNGFNNIPILSYSAKFNSAFYGPYRNAIGTDKTLKGDKATYYLNPPNSKEALKENLQDISEGADMIMIKPAMPYLDIIKEAKEKCNVPVFAYQVSGEYSMIVNGNVDTQKAMMESVMCIKRAGANAIFTYFAMDIAQIINEK